VLHLRMHGHEHKSSSELLRERRRAHILQAATEAITTPTHQLSAPKKHRSPPPPKQGVRDTVESVGWLAAEQCRRDEETRGWAAGHRVGNGAAMVQSSAEGTRAAS
jgi:hypothetical protein